jgi:LAO/AO transport system kinase
LVRFCAHWLQTEFKAIAMNEPTQTNPLFDRITAGDIGALSYAISSLENHTPAGSNLLSIVGIHGASIPVIGFTGPPGVGKSSLISAYISTLRQNDKRVAVVAIDPSSPISRGALLGDRFRMGDHSHDPHVFIRSVSNRGRQGGLCSAIFGIIGLIDAAGWDVVLLETVGAGQSDTDLTDIADVRIVVQSPGLGDDIQAIKAGILEIADILVINKADMPFADLAARQLQGMADFRKDRDQPFWIIKTVAVDNRGIDRLHQAVESLARSWKGPGRQARYLRRMQCFFAKELGKMTEQVLVGMPPDDLAELYEKVLCGRYEMTSVAEAVVGAVLKSLSRP